MKPIRVFAALLLLGSVALADPPRFTDWGAPENLGPAINGPFTDSCVAISRDGRSLFFSSTRQTQDPTSMDRDLYVSKRKKTGAPWGVPQPLTMLNTKAWDSCPALSPDEHRLYFTSARPGGCGGGTTTDLWVSYRGNKTKDLGWEKPANLGCGTDGFVNSAGRELSPTLFVDETGKVLMYFGSDRGTPGGPADLFQSEMAKNETFGPATPLVSLSSPAAEHSVTVRRDGLEVILVSTRGGTLGFWTSTRASTSDPWPPPAFVATLPFKKPATLGGLGGRIALSDDGRELYFSADLPGTHGGLDIWVARRERSK